MEDDPDVGSVTDGIGPADHPAGVGSLIPIAAPQYASNKYTDLLKEHNIDISMSRKGTPLGQRGLRIFYGKP